MYTSPVGMISDSAFGIYKNLDTLTGMATSGDSSQATVDKEKKLTSDNLQKKLAYTAADYMEDTDKKLKKKNFERAFDIFA